MRLQNFSIIIFYINAQAITSAAHSVTLPFCSPSSAILSSTQVPLPTECYQSTVKRVCLTHCHSVLMMKQSISSYFSKNPSTSKDTSAEGAMADADSDEEKEQASEGPTPAAKKKNIKFHTEWLQEFPWLRYNKESNEMHCVYCIECGASAGNTKFATRCSNFKHETIKLHSESIKH